jgi:hypothetical protein
MSKARKIDAAARQAAEQAEKLTATRTTMKGLRDRLAERQDHTHHLATFREHARQIVEASASMPPRAVARAQEVEAHCQAVEQAVERGDAAAAAAAGIVLAIWYGNMLADRYNGATLDGVLWRGVWYPNPSPQEVAMLEATATTEPGIDAIIPAIAKTDGALRKLRATINAKLDVLDCKHRLGATKSGVKTVNKLP